MRNRQTLLIVILALLVAILAFALVYFAKDEWKLAIEPEDDNVPTRSVTRQSNGHAEVELSVAAQQASGIITTALNATRSSRTSEVFGTVVNLQPLAETRARLLSLRTEAAVLRATVHALRTDHERLRTLYAEDRNVSERAVLAAESQLRTEQAHLDANEQSTASQREAMRLAWGATLSAWASNPQSSAMEGLLTGRDVLIQFSLPVDSHKNKADLILGSRRARLISPAPTADVLLPGATFFYAAAADGLRVGMRVAARLPAAGPSLNGVIIPASAIVWHAGKAWVYTKSAEEDDLFVRREISTTEEMDSGFFNVTDWGEDDRVVTGGAQLLLSEELKFQIRNENED